MMWLRKTHLPLHHVACMIQHHQSTFPGSSSFPSSKAMPSSSSTFSLSPMHTKPRNFFGCTFFVQPSFYCHSHTHIRTTKYSIFISCWIDVQIVSGGACTIIFIHGVSICTFLSSHKSWPGRINIDFEERKVKMCNCKEAVVDVDQSNNFTVNVQRLEFQLLK